MQHQWLPLRLKRLVYFILRIDGHSTSRTALVDDLKRGTRCAPSSAEERQRKERGKSRTAHGLPTRTFRMRLRDFRCYHIAISCLGPDDFVDVVHDDFPLCENNEHDLRSRISEFSVSLHYRKSVSYGAFRCKSGHFND